MLEKTLESPLDCKEIQPVHPKGDQSWVFTGRTDAEAETPILWPSHNSLEKPWCWEGLGAGGEGDDRGWDGWMASPTRWAWVWVNSVSWWWTGRPKRAAIHGVAKSWTRLSDWTELNRWGLVITFLIVPSFGTSFTAITVLNSGWPHYLSFTGCMDFPPRCIVFKQSIVVWSLSHVQLFAAPWTAACQTSAPFTISWSLLKLVSIELMMPPNHPVLCRPLLLSSVFPCINNRWI